MGIRRSKMDFRHWEYLHDLTHSNLTVEQAEAKIKLDSNFTTDNPVLQRAIALYTNHRKIWHIILKENYNTKFVKIKNNNTQHEPNNKTSST